MSSFNTPPAERLGGAPAAKSAAKRDVAVSAGAVQTPATVGAESARRRASGGSACVARVRQWAPREEGSGKRRRKAPPQSGNKRTRTGAEEDGGVDEAPQPSLQRTARLRKNQDLLRSLRSQHGARLRLRAERGPSPQELVKQASLAARLQDLDIIRLEAGIERREPAQWDELRVWDPGDG